METIDILIIVDIYGDVIINGDYKWFFYKLSIWHIWKLMVMLLYIP
jgi:hypothetical protein